MDDIKTAMAYDVGLDKARKMTIEDVKNSIESIDAIQFGISIQIGDSTKILYTTKENPYTYIEDSFFFL